MSVPQTMPNILRIIEKPLSMGALSAAIFVVVMYTGALDNRRDYTKKLMSVRAELSILGCIFSWRIQYHIAYSFSKLLIK